VNFQIRVCSSDYLIVRVELFHTVYSVKGDMIRSIVVPKAVATWSALMSIDGFDILFMADAEGARFWFEALFLRIGEELPKLRRALRQCPSSSLRQWPFVPWKPEQSCSTSSQRLNDLLAAHVIFSVANQI
jgi:hypothetical protein